MNDLEKIAMEKITELCEDAFTALVLLPLKDKKLNFNDHILPISSKIGEIKDVAKVIIATKSK